MQKSHVIIRPRIPGVCPSIPRELRPAHRTDSEPGYVMDCRASGLFQMTIDPVPVDVGHDMAAAIRIMPWFDDLGYQITAEVVNPL